MFREKPSAEVVAARMCARIGADYAPMPGRGAGWSARMLGFRAVGDLDRGAKGWVDLLQVRPSGNFGNNYIQLLNALTVAEQAGATRVAHRFEWFQNGGPDRDLRIVRRRRPRAGRVGLEGAYFLRSNIACLRDATPLRQFRISEERLRPYFRLTPMDRAPICLNIRGGADVFKNPAPNGRYGQPPLSFYQRALANLFRQYGEAPVVVVHQDDLNPVLAPLLAWLEAKGVQFHTSSGGPEADAQAILGARHLVMGWTTFTASLALLAPQLDSLTIFRHVQLQELLRLKAKALFLIDDVFGGYFPTSGWANTDEQRQMMLRYPEGALRVQDITGSEDLGREIAAGGWLRRRNRRRRRWARLGLVSP